MPGIYGDLRNLARNPNFEVWNQATSVGTSNAELGFLWTTGVGTSSTYAATRASTGQDSGSFAVNIVYTHAAVSDLHQVAGVVGDFKGQTVSFSMRVATATANCCRPFISTDGGTTRIYGQKNLGLGATTYETVKVEGVAVPTTATSLWYGLELVATGTLFIDASALTLGSAAETAQGPTFGRSAAWTLTSGATGRSVDMSGTATTFIPQALGTLILDLQAAGILG